jgi:acyl carrier protein
MKIISEVKNFLYDESFEKQFKSLSNVDSLLENGIIDSVKMLELISFLEEQYGIKVDDEDLFPENFDTLEAIEQYVRSKMNKAPA